MLKIENLKAFYGDLEILHGINMEIAEGEFVGLIGANAAGKTTVLNSISGLIKKHTGDILFNGVNINSILAYSRVDLGIVQVPEGRRLFSHMTVEENLQLGSANRRAYKDRSDSLERIYELLPVLKEKRHDFTHSLSGGQQQMAAIGRALMAKPKLLMLDEPATGLAPIIVQEIYHIIQEIKSQGTSIILVEQDVHRCLQTVDRAYVIANGYIVLHGSQEDLLHNDEVRSAYLGM